MLIFTFVLVHLTLPFETIAQNKKDSDDDTLRYYLSKSDAVVVAKVAEGLQSIGFDYNPIPVNVNSFHIQVIDSIKGNFAVKELISVKVTRAYNLCQSLPPEREEKIVLFLKGSGDSWFSADKWFAMQPYSLTLVEQLKQIQGQALKKTP